MILKSAENMSQIAQKSRTLTIRRERKIFGYRLALSVFINNRECGRLYNNETIAFTIGKGVYRIYVDISYYLDISEPIRRSDVITISESEEDVFLKTRIKAGLSENRILLQKE